MRIEHHFLRDRTYGNWHRAPSIIRFLPARDAEGMTMVDLDSVLFVEHDPERKIPLCLAAAGDEGAISCVGRAGLSGGHGAGQTLCLPG